MKKMKKIFASLLALAMVLAMLPVAAMAADDDAPDDSTSGIVVSKTATLEGNGTYTIKLSAYATGVVKTTSQEEKKPCDIVLVLDQSGSMKTEMEQITYTANDKTSYTYNNYGNNKKYYYDDGAYYQVNKGYTWYNGSYRYYLYFTKNGTTYYLGTSGIQDTMPTNITNKYTDIWTGVLYTRYTGSITRLQALKIAANNFIANIRAEADAGVDHRIAVVGFASNGSQYTNTELLSTSSVINYGKATNTNYKDALVAADSNRIDTAINALDANGNTYSEYGIDMANKIFAQHNTTEEQDRNRVIVMFTDGYTAPAGTDDIDYSMSDRAIGNALTSKTQYNATVYTVGIFDSANANSDINTNFTYGSTNNAKQLVAANRYMHYVSSNYPNAANLRNGGTKAAGANYYLAAADSDALTDIFKTISKEINTPTTTTELDSNSVLKDVIADEFVLPNSWNKDSNVTVQTINYVGDDQFDEERPETLSSAKVDVNNNTICVSGFDYKSNYAVDEKGDVKTSGKKLIVTITGILPSDAAVTNSQINTNDATSGIYADETSEMATVKFPQPKTILTDKAYVVDYAKPFNMLASDLKMTSGAAYDSFAMDIAAPKYGDLSGMTYSPKTTKWDGYDKFYVFGKSDDSSVTSASANAKGNLWGRMTVVPANNVYYEDTFINTATDENPNGIVGISYSGTWTSDNSLTPSNPNETFNSNVQGWESSLADDSKNSDGTAHKATYGDDNKSASATLTFTGTGIDVYSKTTGTTGTVRATLTGVGDTKAYKTLAADNLAKQGEYYQIPTLSFDNLAYGTYKLTIKVTNQASTRLDYYLDGIRIYNPIKEEDEVVQNAYGAKEINATFTEARKILQSGTYFVDEEGKSVGYSETPISALAPEHEIYLAQNQSVVLKVDGSADNSYYVGLKAPQGASAAEFNNGENVASTSINHASDLYYKVVPASDGTITIKNTSDNTLSITKIRMAGTTESTVMTMEVDEVEEVVARFASAKRVAYNALALTDEDIDEEEKPDINTPTISDKEDETENVEAPEVEIENPSEESPSQENNDNNSSSWLQKLFSGFKGIFGR